MLPLRVALFSGVPAVRPPRGLPPPAVPRAVPTMHMHICSQFQQKSPDLEMVFFQAENRRIWYIMTFGLVYSGLVRTQRALDRA